MSKTGGADSQHPSVTWWTDDRRDRWERLDEATRRVRDVYETDHSLVGGLSIYASAPNPYGIRADRAPDAWYATLPYEGDEVHVDLIAALLADILDEEVTVEPRGDEWAGGVWLLVDDWPGGEDAAPGPDVGSGTDREVDDE